MGLKTIQNDNEEEPTDYDRLNSEAFWLATDINIELGDKFPPISVTTRQGDTTNCRALVRGVATLFAFIQWDSNISQKFLRFWSSYTKDSLRAGGIRTIILFADSAPQSNREWDGGWGFQDAYLFNTHYVGWCCGIGAVPILFAVDKYGFVQGIQIGFSTSLDKDITSYISFYGACHDQTEMPDLQFTQLP